MLFRSDREFRQSARPRPRPLLPPRITPAPTHPPTAGIRSYRRYLPLLPHQSRPRPPASRPAPRRGALFCKIRARAHRGGECMHLSNRLFSVGVRTAQPVLEFPTIRYSWSGIYVKFIYPIRTYSKPPQNSFIYPVPIVVRIWHLTVVRTVRTA